MAARQADLFGSPEDVEIVGKGTDLVEAPRPFTYEGDGPRAWTPVSWSSDLLSLLGVGGGEFKDIGAGDALRQGAVIACLDIMAQDIARAPLTLNRVLQEGRRRRGYEVIAPKAHPLAKLFWIRPNEFMTWHELITMLVYHLGLVNNAYLLPIRNRLLDTVSLIPILPSRIRQDVDRNSGRLFYRVRAGTYAEALMYGGEDDLIFFREEIIHIKTRVMNGFSGVSSLSVGNRILSLTDALTRFQDRLFRRDAMSRGVFETPKETELSQPQYDRLKASLGEALSLLRNVGHPLILEGGTTFRPISMTAVEAGAEKTWSQQLAETARLFRIPPHKLMHFEGVKYENMESMERLYVTDSLEPRCLAIEQQLTMMLLTLDEQLDYYVEFDRKALHRSDQKSLNDRVTKQWNDGLITQDEAREELGYNPAKKGKVYKMAANTFLIDENHEVVVTNQASPGDPGAGDDDKQSVNNDTDQEEDA